jgi:hypothetical protein
MPVGLPSLLLSVIMPLALLALLLGELLAGAIRDYRLRAVR